MKRVLAVQAYDCLENVHVTGVIRTYDDWEENREVKVEVRQQTFPSTGVQEGTEWAKDALVALLEAL